MNSIWGGGDFIIFWRWANQMVHCNQKETIKIFVLWDASQPIKLIYMNHNNYLSLSHTLVKNMWLDQYANHSICSATIIVGFEV